MLDHKKYMDEVRKRREVMVKLRQKGWTLQQIGNEYQISAERVRQVLEGASPKPKPNGKGKPGDGDDQKQY